MLTAIIIGIIGLASIAALSKYQSGKNGQKELKMKQDARLTLEAQRFEKLREILTDGVIDSNPAAVDALKPITEVIADQLRGEEDSEKKQLEHKHRLAEIEAVNAPKLKAIEAQNKALEWWGKQIDKANNNTNMAHAFERIITSIQDNTQKLFPNLQLPKPSSPKLLAEKSEDDE